MYARIVTSQVRPGKLNEMTRLYQRTLRPVLEHQPGFKDILVFKNPETNKEISVTLWHTMADMEAFDIDHAPLLEKFAPFLSAAPTVEIFEVSLPPKLSSLHDVPFSESSLGLRVEEPFEWESTQPLA